MTPLLLDTCAVIFIAEGTPRTCEAQGQSRAASIAGLILVSPISAWEVGLLSAKNRFPFRPDPKTWFHRFLAYPGVNLAALTPDVAIDSSFLPPLHSDPADR